MAKRNISIGFIEPNELEGDVIYVQLTKRNKDDVYAEAVSNDDFKHYTFSMSLDRLDQVGRIADSSFGGHESYLKDYGKFIAMLKEENDAEITEERFEQDGLVLTQRLMDIRTTMPEFRKLLTYISQKAQD